MPNRRINLKRAVVLGTRAVRNLARAVEEMQAAVRASNRDGTRTPRRARRKTSQRRRAFLKLQGQYMGLVRRLKPRQKVLVRAIREKKGYEAAIRKARRISA